MRVQTTASGKTTPAKSIMATQHQHSRLHHLIWVLIYGGLLLFVTGLAVNRVDGYMGSIMLVLGALLVAGGVLLVWVRSRLQAQD